MLSIACILRQSTINYEFLCMCSPTPHIITDIFVSAERTYLNLMDIGRSRYLVSPNTYFEVVLYANPGTKLNSGKKYLHPHFAKLHLSINIYVRSPITRGPSHISNCCRKQHPDIISAIRRTSYSLANPSQSVDDNTNIQKTFRQLYPTSGNKRNLILMLPVGIGTSYNTRYLTPGR